MDDIPKRTLPLAALILVSVIVGLINGFIAGNASCEPLLHWSEFGMFAVQPYAGVPSWRSFQTPVKQQAFSQPLTASDAFSKSAAAPKLLFGGHNSGYHPIDVDELLPKLGYKGSPQRRMLEFLRPFFDSKRPAPPIKLLTIEELTGKGYRAYFKFPDFQLLHRVYCLEYVNNKPCKLTEIGLPDRIGNTSDRFERWVLTYYPKTNVQRAVPKFLLENDFQLPDILSDKIPKQIKGVTPYARLQLNSNNADWGDIERVPLRNLEFERAVKNLFANLHAQIEFNSIMDPDLPRISKNIDILEEKRWARFYTKDGTRCVASKDNPYIVDYEEAVRNGDVNALYNAVCKGVLVGLTRLSRPILSNEEKEVIKKNPENLSPFKQMSDFLDIWTLGNDRQQQIARRVIAQAAQLGVDLRYPEVDLESMTLEN